jgi:hypothetical protein
LTTKKKTRKPRVAAEKPKPESSVAAAPPKPLKLSDTEPAKLTDFKPMLCFYGEDKFATFGLTGKERLRRQFARAGISDEISIEHAISHKGSSFSAPTRSSISRL